MKEYYHNYWKQNKNAILEKRRSRYHSDPLVRQKAIQRARERNRLVGNPKCEYGRFFTCADGNKIKLFRIGFLAKYVGRSTYTLWELIKQKKVIPESCFYDGKFRWFSFDHAFVLKKGIDKFTINRNVKLNELKNYLEKEFECISKKYLGNS